MGYKKIKSDKRYDFSKNISQVNYKDKFIIINSEEVKWIVLNNCFQVQIFKLFQSGYSIEEVLQLERFSLSDVQHVVTQIEARKFEGSKKSVTSSKIDDLHIYLTNACNLRCPHCYMFSDKKLPDELTTEEIKAVLKWFGNEKSDGVVTFSGGEPALREDLKELVCYAYECGLKVKLLTNGSLFSLEVIDRLAPFLSSVQISVDGFSELSNSGIRGIGNFQRALNTVDAFLSRGVHTVVSMTPPYALLKDNLSGFIEFAIRMVEKYDAYPFELRFSDELLNGREISNAKEINEDYKKCMEIIQKSIYGEDFRVIEFVRTLMDVTLLPNCAFGNLAIASNGDVFLCPRIHDLNPIGNIRTQTMEELLDKGITARNRTNVEQIEPCCRCEIKYICGGGCRIDELEDFIEGKSLLTRDTLGKGRRECSLIIKEGFYDLMIKSNEYFYS